MNFRSPLVWDFFAISTYFTISLIFWYVGHASRPRDDARPRPRRTRSKQSSSASSASAGTDRTDLDRYEVVYLMLAALATPLVLSVHTIVSMDFATAVVPGWHTTIFPPYFVAGAIFSGMAMVLTLLIVARKTMQARATTSPSTTSTRWRMVTLLTGSLVGYAYATEFFNAWYSGNVYERFAFINRAIGPLRLGLLDDGAVQRADAAAALVEARAAQRRRCCSSISILVNVGMWFERFVIIVVVAAARVPAVELGDVYPTLIEVGDADRQLRPVLHAVPAVHPRPAR